MDTGDRVIGENDCPSRWNLAQLQLPSDALSILDEYTSVLPDWDIPRFSCIGTLG